MQCLRKVFEILRRPKMRVEVVYVLLGVAMVRSACIVNLLRDRRDPNSIEAHSLHAAQTLRHMGLRRICSALTYLDVIKLIDDTPPRPTTVPLISIRTRNARRTIRERESVSEELVYFTSTPRVGGCGQARMRLSEQDNRRQGGAKKHIRDATRWGRRGTYQRGLSHRREATYIPTHLIRRIMITTGD